MKRLGFNRTLCGLIVMTACAASSPTESPQPSEPSEAADLPAVADLDALRKSFDVPGVALIELTKCRPADGPLNLGLADLRSERPVTNKTGFEAASLSKPVFAYLVMQLVDEGVVDLDRPLADEFPYPRIRGPKALCGAHAENCPLASNRSAELGG